MTQTACERDMNDLRATIEQINARPPGIVEPIPEQLPYISFQYPAHKRDPFNSAILEPEQKPEKKKKIDKGVPIDLARPPEILENYPIDSLKYVGTVTKNKTQWALIQSPNDTVHSLTQGNYIGQNFGKIINITDRKIILQETVKNELGVYKHRENALEIAQQ